MGVRCRCAACSKSVNVTEEYAALHSVHYGNTTVMWNERPVLICPGCNTSDSFLKNVIITYLYVNDGVSTKVIDGHIQPAGLQQGGIVFLDEVRYFNTINARNLITN